MAPTLRSRRRAEASHRLLQLAHVLPIGSMLRSFVLASASRAASNPISTASLAIATSSSLLRVEILEAEDAGSTYARVPISITYVNNAILILQRCKGNLHLLLHAHFLLILCYCQALEWSKMLRAIENAFKTVEKIMHLCGASEKAMLSEYNKSFTFFRIEALVRSNANPTNGALLREISSVSRGYELTGNASAALAAHLSYGQTTLALSMFPEPSDSKEPRRKWPALVAQLLRDLPKESNGPCSLLQGAALVLQTLWHVRFGDIKKARHMAEQILREVTYSPDKYKRSAWTWTHPTLLVQTLLDHVISRAFLGQALGAISLERSEKALNSIGILERKDGMPSVNFHAREIASSTLAVVAMVAENASRARLAIGDINGAVDILSKLDVAFASENIVSVLGLQSISALRLLRAEVNLFTYDGPKAGESAETFAGLLRDMQLHKEVDGIAAMAHVQATLLSANVEPLHQPTKQLPESVKAATMLAEGQRLSAVGGTLESRGWFKMALTTTENEQVIANTLVSLCELFQAFERVTPEMLGLSKTAQELCCATGDVITSVRAARQSALMASRMPKSPEQRLARQVALDTLADAEQKARVVGQHRTNRVTQPQGF